MKNFIINVYQHGISIDVWYCRAVTEKGVEKKNKSTFKHYREMGYTWIIEERGEINEMSIKFKEDE